MRPPVEEVVAPLDRADRLPAVLIVEDQLAIAQVLLGALSDAGYAPAHASSAEVAATIAAQVGAAVILLDVMMPGMNGWAVLERLRANPTTREIPVVVTSAVYNRPGLHALPPGGPIRFAAKPFDIKHLLATVAELVRS
jgi:putative two-component system response regulator